MVFLCQYIMLFFIGYYHTHSSTEIFTGSVWTLKGTWGPRGVYTYAWGLGISVHPTKLVASPSHQLLDWESLGQGSKVKPGISFCSGACCPSRCGHGPPQGSIQPVKCNTVPGKGVGEKHWVTCWKHMVLPAQGRNDHHHSLHWDTLGYACWTLRFPVPKFPQGIDGDSGCLMVGTGTD